MHAAEHINILSIEGDVAREGSCLAHRAGVRPLSLSGHRELLAGIHRHGLFIWHILVGEATNAIHDAVQIHR